MILRACFSILVLVHLSSASTCDCYQSQNSTSVFTPSGPKHPDDYSSCYPTTPQTTTNGSCLYVARTNNESVSLCNIQFINFFSPTNSSGMRIVIKDGDDTPFDFTPAELTPSLKERLANFTSKTSELDITMLVSNPNDGKINFYFYTCPKPDEQTTPTTTPAQTFPTISGAPSQPGLIGADIAFAFVSAGHDPDMFNKMTDAITTTVEFLNVVQSNDNPTGVRLGLLAPSATTQPNTFGDQWNLSRKQFTDFLGVLPKMIGIDKAAWIPAFKAFLGGNGSYFDPTPGNPHKPRANVQKIFVFFTQSSPSDNQNDLIEWLGNLTTLDVHMVVVDVRSIRDPAFTALLNIPNFAYTNLTSINDFLFNYVLQSDIDPAYGCKYKIQEIPSESPRNLQDKPQEIPSNGLTVSWPQNFDPDATYPAQYCNNQKSELQLVNTDTTKTQLCVSIPSYELETEKDYLRFYVGGNEIASFTGMDVVGSQFLINSTQTTVTFTTNENTIYKGVKFSIKAVASTITDPTKCESSV